MATVAGSTGHPPLELHPSPVHGSEIFAEPETAIADALLEPLHSGERLC